MKLPSSWKLNPSYFRTTLSFWEGPCSICGVCFSLNKFTSYLSLCLSLNSFWDETSITATSISPETRCVISAKRPWVPIWVTWFQRGARKRRVKEPSRRSTSVWNGDVRPPPRLPNSFSKAILPKHFLPRSLPRPLPPSLNPILNYPFSTQPISYHLDPWGQCQIKSRRQSFGWSRKG